MKFRWFAVAAVVALTVGAMWRHEYQKHSSAVLTSALLPSEEQAREPGVHA